MNSVVKVSLKGAETALAGELNLDLEGERASPVATGGQPWGTVRLRLVAVFGRRLVAGGRLRLVAVFGRRLVGRGLGFGGFFGEAALPCPGVAHGGVDGHFGFPAKHGVGFSGLGPDLLDVAFAACADVVGHFYAGGTFEVVDQFKHGEAAACAEVEDLDGVGVGIVEHALHGRDMSLGEVDNVDVVADA